MNNRDVRICFVGDSFVNGVADPLYLGWVGRLCQTIRQKGFDLTAYNLGIRRNTSADILARWQQECDCRLSDTAESWVVFSLGVNDSVIENGRCRVSEADSEKNVRKLIQGARKQYQVLMIGPPPIDDKEQNQRIGLLDSVFQTVCEQESVAYLSVFDVLGKDPLWRQQVGMNDGAHPGAEGYGLLAGLIGDYFIKLL